MCIWANGEIKNISKQYICYFQFFMTFGYSILSFMIQLYHFLNPFCKEGLLLLITEIVHQAHYNVFQ